MIKLLKFYEKSKIAVSPSTWDEPFGRTSMEADQSLCYNYIK